MLMSSGAGVADEGDAGRAIEEHRKGAGGCRCWKRGGLGGGLGVCVKERGYQRLERRSK